MNWISFSLEFHSKKNDAFILAVESVQNLLKVMKQYN